MARPAARPPGQQLANAPQNPQPVNQHAQGANRQPLGNRVFALQEDQDGTEGTLHISSTSARVLFDTGAAKSFISQNFAHRLGLNVEMLEEPIHVYSPLGAQLTLYSRYVGCPVSIRGRNFPIDLVLMNFGGLDVILGVDWMERYHVIIDVAARTITIQMTGGELLTYPYTESEEGSMSSLITEALSGGEIVLGDIRTASEFEDVFQEVPGLPPHREIEFALEVPEGTMPIS